MHYNTAWQCKKSAKYDIYFQMVRFLKFPSYCVPFLPGCKTNPSSACFVTAAYSARLTHIALSVAACLLQWQIMWPLGPQNLKYLLPVPLQKMFADSWCKLQHNEVWLFSTVAIINYHKLSGLKKHSLLLMVLEVRSLKMGLTGLQSRCQWAMLFLASLRENLFPFFFQFLEATWISGLWVLPSSSKTAVRQRQISLCFSCHIFSDSGPPAPSFTYIYKGICDDSGPIQVIQDNLLISKSVYYHLNLISLILISLGHVM